MLQRVVHDFMVKWIGENWKTTVNGWLTMFIGVSTAAVSWLADHALKAPKSFVAYIGYTVTILDFLCCMARAVVGHWQMDAKN